MFIPNSGLNFGVNILSSESPGRRISRWCLAATRASGARELFDESNNRSIDKIKYPHIHSRVI